MQTFLNRLGSIKLTTTILLLLAVASALGTFLPRGEDIRAWENMVGASGSRMAGTLGFTDFYHSWWFTSLLAVLVVNLAACMANRLGGMLASLSGRTAMGMEAVLHLPGSEESESRAVPALRSAGFRPGRWGGGRVYSKGASSYLFTLLTHGSILLIMAFSLFGSAAGFVATQRVHVGNHTATAFNWKTKGNSPLPFELHADDLALLPNLISVQLGVQDLDSQRKVRVITTHEGGTFKVAGIRGLMKLESFDIDRKDFQVSWNRTDGSRVEVRRDQEIGGSGLSLVPLAYATWPERQVLARVTLAYEDAGDRSGDISVNHPMVSDGIRIYLTDYGEDKFGFPYVGFQFVSDPGQTGLWIGCTLFLVGLTGAAFVRHSCVVLAREGPNLGVYVSSRGKREEIISRLREELAPCAGDSDEAACGP